MEFVKAAGFGVLIMWGVTAFAIVLAVMTTWVESRIGTLGSVAVLVTVIGVAGGGGAYIASRR
jgi:hypothetical protein